MKRWLVCLSLAALMLLLATGVAFATAVVESVDLPEGFTNVDVGATNPLIATVKPDGITAYVTWTSSRKQYASVRKLADGSWVITGRAMGRTIVTARAGGKSKSRMIYVTAPKASTIKLNSRSVTLNPSGAYSAYQLRAATTPTYHSDSVIWKSSDDSVATVSDTGLVKAIADGSETKTCTITATLKNAGKSAVCTVTVLKIPEKYVRMATSAVVPLYSTRPLTAVVYPVSTFDKTVTWSVVKNPLIASVDEKGVVTGLQKGTAVIEARTVNGRTARCTVTVKLVRYASFSVTPSSRTVEKDDSYALRIRRSPTYVSYPDLTITSDSADIAAVTQDTDGNWVVKGVSRGYTILRVSGDNGRVKRNLSVRVIDSSQSIQVSISAIGDVMLGGDPRKSSYRRFANLWDEKKSAYFFAKIKSQLKDISIANLEIPLTNTTRVMQGSRSYIFRGRTDYAQALQEGGIDAVDLDNNHIMDYGATGYRSTKSAVRKYGVDYFGLGSVFYKESNGVRIGFAGYRPESISIAKLKASVRAIQQRCDIVVVSFHWGTQYRYAATAQQVAYGHAAVLAGADLVLGHHTHVVGGIEIYKGKHIVYGLGTIMSTVELPKDIDCFIYQHTFSVKGTDVSDAGYDAVPVLMSDNTSYNDAQPVLATGSDKTRILNKIKKYSSSGISLG